MMRAALLPQSLRLSASTSTPRSGKLGPYLTACESGRSHSWRKARLGHASREAISSPPQQFLGSRLDGTSKSPIVDKRPGAVLETPFVGEAELVFSILDPGHPPFGINPDHCHEPGKDDSLTTPTFTRSKNAIRTLCEYINPLLAERVEGDVGTLSAIWRNRADPGILFTKREFRNTGVDISRIKPTGGNVVFIFPGADEPAKLLHLGSTSCRQAGKEVRLKDSDLDAGLMPRRSHSHDSPGKELVD